MWNMYYSIEFVGRKRANINVIFRDGVFEVRSEVAGACIIMQTCTNIPSMVATCMYRAVTSRSLTPMSVRWCIIIASTPNNPTW